ncbi:hypothetical protein AX774_g3455 [Zancudomyces culisetae]|uniref:Uncharacterized protein n=1 Tax=Zancudomyces culisetae TaxID=1213189 RepID=A0A1R1PQ13_ZANCU|nr:hypothetical protein AX774_g3455 [Zancudomyces culisetae]|eukprot:OMH83054.1 hypothetical protein AX774_g3455 [Zancudomyces culisetae]
MDFCGILFTDCKRQVENEDSGRNAENGCVKPRDIKCTQYAPQTMHFDTIIYDEKRWSDFNEIKRPVVALRPESTLTFITKDKMNIESYYLPDISGGDLIKEIERLSNRVKELESMTNNSHSSNIINFHERAPAGQEFNAKKHHYTVDNNNSNKKTIRRLLKNNNVIKNKCMAKRDGIERKQYTPVYKKRKSILLSGLKVSLLIYTFHATEKYAFLFCFFL